MHRIRRPRLIAVLTALLLLSGLPVAATPIVDVNDAGVRILTVPGTGTIAANGGVATEINNDNWIVVEEAQWFDFTTSPPINRTGGLLWKGSGVVEPFAHSFMANNLTSKFDVADLNERGEIVGNLRLNGATGDRMFHWSEAGGLSYISSPPAIDPVVLLQEVHGIADDGTVTGWYRPDTSIDPCGDNFLICGFVGQPDSLDVIADSTFTPTAISDGLVAGNGMTWTESGGLVDLADSGVARAVNTSGEIAGSVNLTGNNTAAYWPSPSSPATIIGTLPGDTHSYAWGMNESGWVVGWSGPSSNPSTQGQGFLWRPGVGIEPLGFLPGGSESAAYDVNDNGLIVGQSDGRAVIWDMTGTFDITYPDPVQIDPVPDTEIAAGDTLSLTATASGAGLPQFVGIYSGVPGSLSPAPVGLTVSSSGEIAWATDENDVGTYTVSVEVLDFHELTSPAGYATFTIEVTGDAQPLVLVIDETVAIVDMAELDGFPLLLEVVESIAVSDDVRVNPPLSITVVEGVTVGDSTTVTTPLVLTINESITVEDQPDVSPSLFLSITESLVVSDTPTITPPLLLEIIETVGVGDVVAVAPDSMGSIDGTVWFDSDGNGVFNQGEPPMAGVDVYLDLNDDGTRDAGDPMTTTDAQGIYSFPSVIAGDWVVRQVIPTGYEQTFPELDGPHRVTVSAGVDISDLDFGNAQSPGLPPVIDPIDDQFVVAGQEIVIGPNAFDPEGLPLDHQWTGDIPPNAVINGIFAWQPTSDQAPGMFELIYTAYEAGNPDSATSETFRIFVSAPDVTATGPVIVTPLPPVAGDPITVSGGGFEAGTQVGVHVFSEPTFLGTTTVGPNGVFELKTTLPTLPAGTHRIVAIGVGSDGEIRTLGYTFEILGGDPDSDADGLTNAEEGLTGTDPNMADTDGDGLVDGLDASWLHDFVNQLSNRDLRWGWFSRIQLQIALSAADAAVRSGQRTIAIVVVDALAAATDTCGKTMDRYDLISNCQARSEFADLLSLYSRNIRTMDLPSRQSPWRNSWR